MMLEKIPQNFAFSESAGGSTVPSLLTEDIAVGILDVGFKVGSRDGSNDDGKPLFMCASGALALHPLPSWFNIVP